MYRSTKTNTTKPIHIHSPIIILNLVCIIAWIVLFSWQTTELHPHTLKIHICNGNFVAPPAPYKPTHISSKQPYTPSKCNGLCELASFEVLYTYNLCTGAIYTSWKHYYYYSSTTYYYYTQRNIYPWMLLLWAQFHGMGCEKELNWQYRWSNTYILGLLRRMK